MNTARQTPQRDVRQSTPTKSLQRSRQASFDRDATIRSHRSNVSTRSSLQNIVQSSSIKDSEDRKRYDHSHSGPINRNQVPPPPPYQASNSPFLDVRRDSSPSTIMSYESNRWDDGNNRNPRWSTWTADSTLLLSDEGNMDENIDQEMHTSFSKALNRGRRSPSPLDFQNYERDHQIAGPSNSPPTSRSSTPPSPTSEAALDAALSSTMLALTTANSLLLSTMSSRRELARLRALEAELDSDLTKKEEDIKRQIEFNRKTTRWMERACKKLDDVIQGREPLNGIESIDELDELNAKLQGPSNIPSSTPGSRFMARHDRAPSTAATDSKQLAATFGIVEAKDDTATIGKSAAKRLERMLHKSTPLSGQIAESGSALPPRLANTAFAQSHSRTSSAATTGSESARSEDANGSTKNTANMRPNILRNPGNSVNALQLRLSSSRLATPLTATTTTSSPAAVTSSDGTPVSEKNLRQLDGTSTASSRQSFSGKSMSDVSAITSNAAENAIGRAGTEEGSGSGSGAAKLLSTFVNSRPSSRLSVGTNAAEQGEDSTYLQAAAPNATATSQFLTPPMPNRDLALADESYASTGTPALLKRQSISNIRSPSAMRMGSGHARGTGSSVADDIQGIAITDKNGGRKGALEALRRLNSNGNTSTTNAEAGSVSNDTLTPATNDPLRGWGGTFASWIGVGRSSADNTPSVDDASNQTSEPSMTASAPRDAAFNVPDLAV